MAEAGLTILDNTLALFYLLYFLAKMKPRWIAEGILDGNTSFQAMAFLELVFMFYLLIRIQGVN